MRFTKRLPVRLEPKEQMLISMRDYVIDNRCAHKARRALFQAHNAKRMRF